MQSSVLTLPITRPSAVPPTRCVSVLFSPPARQQAYGFDPAATFADVTSDADLASRLSAAYGGDIDNLDALTGALAEGTSASTGGVMGDVLVEAWADQLTRSIAGDRCVCFTCVSRGVGVYALVGGGCQQAVCLGVGYLWYRSSRVLCMLREAAGTNSVSIRANTTTTSAAATNNEATPTTGLSTNDNTRNPQTPA